MWIYTKEWTAQGAVNICVNTKYPFSFEKKNPSSVTDNWPFKEKKKKQCISSQVVSYIEIKCMAASAQEQEGGLRRLLLESWHTICEVPWWYLKWTGTS